MTGRSTAGLLTALLVVFAGCASGVGAGTSGEPATSVHLSEGLDALERGEPSATALVTSSTGVAAWPGTWGLGALDGQFGAGDGTWFRAGLSNVVSALTSLGAPSLAVDPLGLSSHLPVAEIGVGFAMGVGVSLYASGQGVPSVFARVFRASIGRPFDESPDGAGNALIDPVVSDDAGEPASPDPDDQSPGALFERLDDELLPDDEIVVGMLRAEGGRLRQRTIVDETTWSKAKVSRLLARMAEEDAIEKVPLGRENLICLDGHVPEPVERRGDGSPESGESPRATADDGSSPADGGSRSAG